MSNTDDIRKKMLETKEQRWQKQKELVKKFKVNLLSFKFNIPALPKADEPIKKAFVKSLNDFSKYLFMNRISFDYISGETTVLGFEAYLISKHPARKLKELTIAFEEDYPIGRILDIDVMDQKGNYLDRENKRKCFLCDDSAIKCIRTRKHSLKDLRKFVDEKISFFNIDAY
ncbi:MAG: citrate lyase holo-[acyl-carrier protein] synthase [Asgard group archaeon]|nr:citrate lyase holo-[acyl-carrier protein] synthase [Asgard group archaeon]